MLQTATDPADHREINQILETRINERNRILEQQGKSLAWRSKTKWYNEGEKSNKYFLNLLKSGSSKNEMSKIKVGNEVITEPDRINFEVNKFYQELYNTNEINIETNTNDLLSQMFTLNQDLADTINRPITLIELWTALKPLKDTAPGPDGISHIYLKKLWDVMGPIILNAWNYSIAINKMPPSHYKSYLKLIPKIGKDLTLLKNWRPITLSNCDHKLVTRIYNNRLLTIVSDQITNLQTAYIRNRNITDNIRLINSAIQLAQFEPQVSGSIIALDAQKAFDTVRHDYLRAIMCKIGLSNFIPTFNLLYADINNDMLINGEIKGNHKIKNGVKQGDALSCTLFLLAIEPLIRNLQNNLNIKPIKSLTLQYTWPKVYAYADDITCIIQNEPESKQILFSEYESFSKISGLKLNADKTEVYYFGMAERQQDITNISYLNTDYNINPVDAIKINGIFLCQNQINLKNLNMNLLIEKMDRHFTQWSKRNLSLLGKIQIYKTFGMSQFLYHLSIFEPSQNQWKKLDDRIRKFLWNKKYEGNTAPARIKKYILEAPISSGGFGMIDIKQVVSAMRLRRHFLMTESNIHPMHELIHHLTQDNDYLDDRVELEIEEITKLNLTLLKNKKIGDYKAPEWQLESDIYLQSNLLNVKLGNLVRTRKLRSREAIELQMRGIHRLQDALQARPSLTRKLISIVHKDLTKIITIILNNQPANLLQHNSNLKIMDKAGKWLNAVQTTSKKIRDIFFEKERLCYPKITWIDNELLAPYYTKISKLSNIANKTKILRLLHGDVYTADRLVRFGMSDSDKCRRCFGKETIMHLLTECPYSLEIYEKLGLRHPDCNEILGVSLGRSALEIRCDILSYLLFRLHILPTEVLIKTTLEKYSRDIARNEKVKRLAVRMLQSQTS